MDPKTASNLDPKLKEVYDRVMGSANPKASPPPQTTQQSPASPMPHASQLGGSLNQTPPLPNPNTTILTTPPQNATSPIPGPALAHETINPLNASPLPSLNSSTPPPPLSKPTVDYAALAAKYATPTPTISTVNASVHQTPVTPSSTTYGVVDNKSSKSEKAKDKTEGSPTKKILLIAGLPIMLIIYAAIWIFIFHVDIMGFLPLPK